MIHHSAMAAGPTSGAEAVREIWNLHALERGWGDIGYHFLIDSTGHIYEGRCGGVEAVGGHFKGGNEGTIGICLLGNFMTDVVPESALNALVDLLATLTARLKIPPSTARLHRQTGLMLPTISGHRDGDPTTLCPGDALYERLFEVKQRAELRTD